MTFSVFLSCPYSGGVKFIADDERAWWLGGGRPAALIMVIVDRCCACGGLNLWPFIAVAFFLNGLFLFLVNKKSSSPDFEVRSVENKRNVLA